MNTRPFSIVILGWLFLLFGFVSFITGLLPLLGLSGTERPVPSLAQLGIAEISRLLAILGGAGLLLGRNWARWLLVGWMAYHVLIGWVHSPGQAMAHALLLVALSWFLFRPHVSAHFRDPQERQSATP